MKLLATSYFIRKLNKLTSKNSSLTKKINQQLSILTRNKYHPSLRLHKLTGKQDEWSIFIESNIRIIFQYTPEGILLTDIGSHDAVY